MFKWGFLGNFRYIYTVLRKHSLHPDPAYRAHQFIHQYFVKTWPSCCRWSFMTNGNVSEVHDVFLTRLACSGWSHSSHSRSLQMRSRPHHRTWLRRSVCQSHTRYTCARSRKGREKRSVFEISWTRIKCFATEITLT